MWQYKQHQPLQQKRYTLQFQVGSTRLVTAATNDLLLSFLLQEKTHKLVGDIGVVPAGHSLPDSGLHESRQGGQHVDGRVNLEQRKHKSNCRQRQLPAT